MRAALLRGRWRSARERHAAVPERGVVQPHALYCCRKCTMATLCDARWRSLPTTTHRLQRGEHALVYFPGQDGGPSGDNYFQCVIRDFYLKRPLNDSMIRVWVLPVKGYVGHPTGYKGYSLKIPVEGFRGNELYRNKKLLHGLKEKWPGRQKCRFCQSTTELVVCPQADCPWGPSGDYAVCSKCREESWEDDKCEACRVQDDVNMKASQATETAVALFEARGPQLVRASLQPAACVEHGWVMYSAKRILTEVDGKRLKGLWPCGIAAMDVPVDGIVVDVDTGEFVCARVRMVMGGNLPGLKKDLASDGTPSAPCGAKGGPARISEFLTGVGEKLDGVSTLASLRLKVPGADCNL